MRDTHPYSKYPLTTQSDRHPPVNMLRRQILTISTYSPFADTNLPCTNLSRRWGHQSSPQHHPATLTLSFLFFGILSSDLLLSQSTSPTPHSSIKQTWSRYLYTTYLHGFVHLHKEIMFNRSALNPLLSFKSSYQNTFNKIGPNLLLSHAIYLLDIAYILTLNNRRIMLRFNLNHWSISVSTKTHNASSMFNNHPIYPWFDLDRQSS